MKLSDWIKKRGALTVAQELGLSFGSVYRYQMEAGLPSDVIKMKIKELSGGKVSYAEMIEPVLNKTKKQK